MERGMKYVMPDLAVCYEGTAGRTGPVIYVIDMSGRPFEIDDLCAGLAATVVAIPVEEWDDSLTPWPAPGLYPGDPDFAGDAGRTLTELLDMALPVVDDRFGLAPSQRAICGYSLAGLFAMYAFVHSDTFEAAGCLSASVWYEGWLDHLRSLPLELSGKFAFLSIGSQEREAPEQILHCVEDNMEACAGILREVGCETRFEVGPGHHMEYARERFITGLGAIDAFFRQEGSAPRPS
ncbi:alpha/beta hydrolase-fold protein [Actinomyces wuliandei]|uniref:alpha/beta hydrolase-fold protein n=1 Tax=Actinomyces wuliandei TaxID=2057743 RepID=UPI0019D44B6C|nr:alpha/beta hydrolase-fold protein [Actinomyces wuliandei]